MPVSTRSGCGMEKSRLSTDLAFWIKLQETYLFESGTMNPPYTTAFVPKDVAIKVSLLFVPKDVAIKVSLLL